MDWLQGPGAVICGAAASGAVVGFLIGRASAPPATALDVLGIGEIGTADWPDWVSPFPGHFPRPSTRHLRPSRVHRARIGSLLGRPCSLAITKPELPSGCPRADTPGPE